MILLFLCVIVVGCAHPVKKEPTPAVVSVSVLKEAACAGRASLHYAAIGLGGATDLVFVLSSGILVGTTLCSPALLLDSRAGGSSNLTGQCVEAFLRDFHFPLWGFPVSKWARAETEGLLCQENITFSET
ncbi:MAG: hypothetical protein NXH75_04295 [Halobacteriovoraceae bacterium]|nr:hypothetical protein [Halobacteriovoraceae bacterium]